jgi:PAS domain S-box-containing protein
MAAKYADSATDALNPLVGQLSVAQLQVLVEHASDGIFIADVNGLYTFVNESGCRMLGCSRAEVIGKTIFDLIPNEDVELLLASKSAMLQGATHVAEWRLRRKDGSWLPVEVSAKILADGQWQGFVRDISERKAHQARNDALFRQLEEERQWLKGIFDILPVGVWIADRDGRIMMSNRAGDQIWQGTRYVGPEQFSEYKARWVETGKPIAPEEWGLARAIRGGEIAQSELIRIQCFDGSFKTIINWAAPLHAEDGAITGAIAVNEDVTALQYTQEQLRAAVRDREDILAIVTHDLRNPLSSLQMTADAMERESRTLAEDTLLRCGIAAIRDTVRRMSGLVDDLLAVSVAQGGHSMLKLAPITPSILLNSAAEARSLLATSSLHLELSLAPDLPMLNIDGDRILRVLTNLLDNALKFTAAGRILISAEPVAGGVRFAVANSGEPLSSETLKTMFQPFWQAARNDRRGAGLGLSICRSIVEAHGGTIWAEPAQGERVRVCFVLPRAPVVPA